MARSNSANDPRMPSMRVARGSVDSAEKVKCSLTNCTTAPLAVIWSTILRRSTRERPGGRWRLSAECRRGADSDMAIGSWAVVPVAGRDLVEKLLVHAADHLALAGANRYRTRWHLSPPRFAIRWRTDSRSGSTRRCSGVLPICLNSRYGKTR